MIQQLRRKTGMSSRPRRLRDIGTTDVDLILELENNLTGDVFFGED